MAKAMPFPFISRAEANPIDAVKNQVRNLRY
jgi:hypothetical protein